MAYKTSNSPSIISSIEVDSYLEGIKYPISKKKLLKQLKKENVPAEILLYLNEIQDKNYNSRDEILEGLMNQDPRTEGDVITG